MMAQNKRKRMDNRKFKTLQNIKWNMQQLQWNFVKFITKLYRSIKMECTARFVISFPMATLLAFSVCVEKILTKTVRYETIEIDSLLFKVI